MEEFTLHDTDGSGGGGDKRFVAKNIKLLLGRSSTLYNMEGDGGGGRGTVAKKSCILVREFHTTRHERREGKRGTKLKNSICGLLVGKKFYTIQHGGGWGGGQEREALLTENNRCAFFLFFKEFDTMIGSSCVCFLFRPGQPANHIS